MALTTRDRRASALGRGLSWLTIFPLPDGTVDAADRRHMLGLYRGFAESPSPPPPPPAPSPAPAGIPSPGLILGAIRQRLATDPDLQTYVGVDGTESDPSAARVQLKWSIETTPAHYPAVTIYQERVRLDPTITRTWNSGFVLISCYSNNRDQRECLEMYEVISRLLHGKKTELSSSTLGVCVHEVIEWDVRGPLFVEKTSCWRLDVLYRIKASVID